VDCWTGSFIVADKQVRTVVELRAGSLSEQDVEVELVRGEEAISAPFRFHLTFRPVGKEPLDLPGLVGTSATLALRRPGGDEQSIRGVLARVSLDGVKAGRAGYTAILVPRFALLAQTRDSCVFQNQSVPDIVRTVLDSHGVQTRSSLSSQYPRREFCVQYRESDLTFVSRLLEEEGIFYFFDHSGDEETLVLADGKGAISDISGEPRIPFRDLQESRDETETEQIYRWEVTQELRTGKVSLNDHTFDQPDLDLLVSVEALEGKEREVYEHPGGYTGPVGGKRLAKVRMEALRVWGLRSVGRSTCLRFASGRTFSLEEHPRAELNQSMLLLRIKHRVTQEARTGSGGDLQCGYANEFVALPASSAYRPRRHTPRPVLRGAQTALVVGASGEEIHTDASSRVKVRFHWDRHGPQDDGASCYLPIARSWAGAGMGQVMTPRVGDEVLVQFVHGDLNHPVVVGALYNGARAAPVSLPDEKVDSVLRTDSSPGGGGNNELRFTDDKGNEKVSVRAQKDERVEVLHDKEQSVERDESLNVEGDRKREVRGNQSLQVARNDITAVKRSQTDTVSGNRLTRVGVLDGQETGRVHSVTVQGSMNVLVGEAAATTVGAGAALTVGGILSLAVGGVGTTAVGGLLARTVAGSSVEVVGKSRDETVGESQRLTIGGDSEEQAGTNLSSSAGKDLEETLGANAETAVKDTLAIMAKSIEIDGDQVSLVVGGKLLWEMKKSGDLAIAASNLTVDASSEIKLKGSKVAKESSASAGQKQVKLKELADLAKSRGSVKVAAKSVDGDPVANVRFKAELPDGSTVEGITDAEGRAAIPASKQGEVKLSFPDLDAGSWKTG
jgi:type VI secretion system secreted protein VgrG